MTAIEFTPWPKIARLNRDIVVTEKIDGTNAAIGISGDAVYAQSRNRIITPGDDNYGFAKWVDDNAGPLFDTLGQGVHFGEWWGRKIARGYDKTDRTFSLFNTSRWTRQNTSGVEGLSVVPTLYFGPFNENSIQSALRALKNFGSDASPGFMRPEGVVIFHTASNVMFKVTIEGDEKPKGQK